MPTKEEIDCPICEHKKYTKIPTSGRDYFRTHIAICKKCGFTYQNLRWTKESLLKFYQNSYDKYYRPTFLSQNMTTVEYNSYKYGFNPLFNRIDPFVLQKKSLRILDVGSGDGTHINYLGSKYPNSKLFAIEPSKEALSALNEKGIQVLSNDVDSDWHLSCTEKFDIITLRHVFEHLQYPNKFLQKVKTVLNEGGILYLAVPDAYNLATLPFSRDFARIVHHYYFTKKSLTNILHKNGLGIHSIREGDEQHDSELFAVIGLSSAAKPMDLDSQEHDKQLQYLAPYIARDKKLKYKLIDYKNYVMRRIYPIKVRMKRALGLIR